jgi:hypothetical protein
VPDRGSRIAMVAAAQTVGGSAVVKMNPGA